MVLSVCPATLNAYIHTHKSLPRNISSTFSHKCHKTGATSCSLEYFYFIMYTWKKSILKMFTFISIIEILFCFYLHVELMYGKSRNSLNKKTANEQWNRLNTDLYQPPPYHNRKSIQTIHTPWLVCSACFLVVVC